VHSGINAYDFLTDYDCDRGISPALHPDGPGSALADATIPFPDDPSIGFDDGERSRRFQAWGATFSSPPGGSEPPTLCSAQRGQKAGKSYALHFQAHSEMVFMLWGGHLASSLDWEDGRAAASISGAAFHMKLDVPGPRIGERDRSIHLVLPLIAPTPTSSRTCHVEDPCTV